MSKSTMITSAVVLVVSCLTMSVKGMSNQVPAAACDSMIPLGHMADAQTSTAPYIVMVPAGPIPVDSEINVVISGVGPSDMFKGFFIRAFETATGTPVGMFIQAPGTIDCNSPRDGAHHVDPTPKEFVMLSWIPSAGFQGSVTFMATIVLNQPTFWTGIKSSPVTFA